MNTPGMNHSLTLPANLLLVPRASLSADEAPLTVAPDALAKNLTSQKLTRIEFYERRNPS
jgi:hypothetical protein